MLKSITSILLIFFCLVGCSKKRETNTLKEHNLTLEYAKGFSISRSANYKTVQVHQPYNNASKGLTYILYDKGSPRPNIVADAYIETPISSIVCTSTTHLPLLEYLGVVNTLVGFPSTDYICSPKIRDMVNENKIEDVGVDDALNMERLVNLNPDLVMTYSINSDYSSLQQIEDLGMPVIINSGYLENHPLGRVEWLKFLALLYGKEAIADSVFNSIKERYLNTKQLLSKKHDKPTVLTGILYGDTWFLPGGDNYAATLFKDAGYAYPWASDTSKGALSLSFETVFDKARNTDYWIGVGNYNSKEELLALDERYKEFTAFNNTFSNNKRLGEKGGSDYHELGYIRPDLILKDLVKIAHPELLPEYNFVFHEKLK